MCKLGRTENNKQRNSGTVEREGGRMMQIVIDIPEEFYEYCKSQEDAIEIQLAVKNGTPLPKGHKRLIEDNFEVGPVFDKEGNRIGYQYVTQEDLNNPTATPPACSAIRRYMLPSLG